MQGGLNTYQYAPNPVVWVDPFGLETTLTGGVVYRWGNSRPNNLTPRPGKDTDSGLSASLDLPTKGDYLTLNVESLNKAGLEAINDHGNHVSIRPANDPDKSKLVEWANTRGTEHTSDYTTGVKDAIVKPDSTGSSGCGLS